MAAEVSSEETGSVTTGTGVAGGGGPEAPPFPYYPKSGRVRVTDLGQGQGPAPTQRQHSNTSPDSLPDMSVIYPLSSGDVTGPLPSAAGSGGAGQSPFQGTSSGIVCGTCYSPTSEGPASRISPTSTGPDGTAVFPPLPPPPPPPPGCGGLGGAMDESDMQDGPEVEEEEVVFPLSAPPTNQWVY